MRVSSTVVLVAQVRVRIELEDHKVGVASMQGWNGTEGDRVLAPSDEWECLVPERGHASAYCVNGGLRRTVSEVKVAEVGERDRLQITI